jgi:hypothetical protein
MRQRQPLRACSRFILRPDSTAAANGGAISKVPGSSMFGLTDGFKIGMRGGDGGGAGRGSPRGQTAACRNIVRCG